MAQGQDSRDQALFKEVLDLVANDLDTDEWKWLGLKLDFKISDLNILENVAIEEDSGQKVLCRTMLENWYRKFPGRDWLKKLESSVRKIDRNDIGNKLKSLRQSEELSGEKIMPRGTGEKDAKTGNRLTWKFWLVFIVGLIIITSSLFCIVFFWIREKQGAAFVVGCLSAWAFGVVFYLTLLIRFSDDTKPFRTVLLEVMGDLGCYKRRNNANNVYP